ncbi:MAG: MotA/TolQ/ExbB proton channel family protein [Mariprofundales bacterium]|nr:MotA/TolQ/ExbB proton channel family protein [Mariprofundales bacterium]
MSDLGTGQQRALDQRGLKTLTLWMIWAATIISVFVILYHKVDIFRSIREDTSHITWLILGMFILAILISFIHTLILTLEWFRAYRIARVLQQKGLSGVRPRRRVVDRFISSLQQISAQGGTPDVGGLIDVEFAAHHRGSSFVTLMGNLLITMGLIGTVLGMTMMLSGLNSSLSAIGENQKVLLDGLSSAMSGMGIAFYTTLLGSILGGVLLKVFAWITDTSIDGLEDLMMRNCLVHASTDLSTSPDRDLRLMNQQMQQLETRMQALHTTFADSRRTLGGFTDEIDRLNAAMKISSDGEEVLKALSIHRYYASLLRSELRMHQRLKHQVGAIRFLFARLRGKV